MVAPAMGPKEERGALGGHQGLLPIMLIWALNRLHWVLEQSLSVSVLGKLGASMLKPRPGPGHGQSPLESKGRRMKQ